MRLALRGLAAASVFLAIPFALELRGVAMPLQDAGATASRPAQEPNKDPARRTKADDLLGPATARPAPPQPPASQPAAEANGAAGGGRTRTPEQANVLKELLRDSDRSPAAPPSKARLGGQPARKPAADENLMMEGQLIVERSGRLIRRGERSAFQFIAEEKGGQTLTLELLENAWLDFMEQESEGREGEFIITAEVTQYRGKNLLLLRSFRQQVRHGNIAP